MSNIGRSFTKKIALTVTAGAYSDGDVVGGLINLSALCGVLGGGTIRQIRLVDDGNIGAALYVYLFDDAPTAILDNAVFATAFVIADHKAFIGRISIATGDYLTINSNKVAVKDDINLSHGTGSLYAYIVTNGSTPTYLAVDNLTLIVTGWLD